MAEALSQSQIDELLKAAKENAHSFSEAVSTVRIKEYDFSSPKKFTKDQLKSLSGIYDSFGRVLTSYLSTILRDSCSLNVIDVEELRFIEFSNSLPDATLIGLVSYEAVGNMGSPSTLLLEFPTSFGYLLTERTFGASGKPYLPDRGYTEIESSILNIIFTNIARYMEETWRAFFEIKTTLAAIETNGRLIQSYEQQDIIVITSIEVEVGSYTGVIHLCVPADNLDKIIDSFTSKHGGAVKSFVKDEHEDEKKELVFSYLKDSELSMEAILDDFEISLQDVAYLQPGDVISLDKKIDSTIDIIVEGVPWGTAKIGENNKNKAIKIVDVFDSKGGVNFDR